MAKPSSKSKEVTDEICRRISEGQTLRSICRDDHMPAWRTVYDWIAADAELSARFARAREDGYDAIAEECLEIADESAFDAIEGEGGRITANAEFIQRSKLRVETRLKLLAKWSPKKYGDKIQTEHSGSVAVSKTDLTDDQLAAIAASGR